VHIKVNELLEKLFINMRANNRLLCTLRAEITMALHDANAMDVCTTLGMYGHFY
jgi:hypothetical protein